MTVERFFELIEDGNGWSLLHEKRNLTSHTYDESLAKDVYEFVRDWGERFLPIWKLDCGALLPHPYLRVHVRFA